MEHTVIGSSDQAQSPDVAQHFFLVAAEVVAVVDEHANVHQTNPAFAALTGTTTASAAGQPLASLLQPTDPLSLSDLIARARLGESSPSNEIECNVGAQPRMLDATLHVIDDTWLFVARDITDQHRLAGELTSRTTHTLGNLANLSGLRDAVDLELKMSGSVAVIQITLVDLPAIATEHGETLTNELLQAAVSRIRRNLRDTDLVARVSDKAFAVMMAGDDVGSSAERLGEQLVSSLARTFGVKGKRIDAQSAIGVAVGTSASHTTESLLQAAHGASLSAEVPGTTSMSVAERAADATEHGSGSPDGFDVAVGGIFRSDGQGALGLEVFLEAKRTAMERISADPTQQRSLTEKLDAPSLLQAAQSASPWLLAHPTRRLCVNVDHEQLKDSGLFTRFASVCNRVGLDPRVLVIEVTERTLSRLGGRAIETIRPIRQEGFELAIDDFGARGATLQLLDTIPATYVKLDPRFTRELLDQPVARATAQAVHTVASAAGMHVVATEVTTEAQLAEIRSIGIPYVQGSYVHAVESAKSFAAKVGGH